MGRGLRIGARADQVAPSFLGAGPYVLALSSTSYILAWPHAYDAFGVSLYEYSLDNGSSWSSAGTNVFVQVTGRTPSTTDHVKVRSYDSSENISSYASLDVVLPASGPTWDIRVIGTGTNPLTGGACDYANPKLWGEAGTTLAGGSSLISANKALLGLCLNQEFVNVPVDLSGMTADATRYRHLSAFPGCSFVDHPNRDTNPLRYNASVGAAIRHGSVLETPAVDLAEGYSAITRMQVATTGNGSTTYGGWTIHTSSSGAPVRIEQNIIQSGGHRFTLSANYYAHQIINNLIVNVRASGITPALQNLAEENNGCEHYGCIFAALGQVAPVATVARVAASYFEACAFFGATYLHDIRYGTGDGTVTSPTGTGAPTYVSCVTDTNQCLDINGSITGLPSGVTQIAFDTSTGSGFQSILNGMGNYDFRLKSSSAMRNAASANATKLSVDITGKMRATSGLIDIGPWQT